MSINHFKAELSDSQDDWAKYKFFPDIINFESDFGQFKVKIKSLANDKYEFQILNFPNNLEIIGEYRCKSCVAAIISKLKGIIKNGESPPKEIYHIS